MSTRPLPHTQVTLSGVRWCTFCNLDGKKSIADYDFRTQNGRWAYGCAEHYREHRMHTTLGPGKGQRLMYVE